MSETVLVGIIVLGAVVYTAYRLIAKPSCGCSSGSGGCCAQPGNGMKNHQCGCGGSGRQQPGQR